MTRKLKKKAPSLAEVFDLNTDDLSRNAEGALADPQRGKLRKAQMRYWTGAILAVAFKLMTLWLYQALRVQDVSAAGLALVVLFGVAMSVSALWSIYQALVIQMDLNEGRIASSEERVFMDIEQHPVYFTVQSHHTLHVAGLHFPVDKRTFLAFQHGAPYRIYYSKRSKVLLGAERLYETNITPVHSHSNATDHDDASALTAYDTEQDATQRA